MPAQCSQSQRVRGVVRKIEAALCSQLLVLCILQTHATGTHQAVELCAFGRFDRNRLVTAA